MDTFLLVIIILFIFWIIKLDTEGIKNVSCNTKDCKIYSHLEAMPICKELCNNQTLEYTGNYKIDTQKNSCECKEPLNELKFPVGRIERFADLSIKTQMDTDTDDTEIDYNTIEEKRLKRYSDLIFG
jgi:hypothetical protein